ITDLVERRRLERQRAGGVERVAAEVGASGVHGSLGGERGKRHGGSDHQSAKGKHRAYSVGYTQTWNLATVGSMSLTALVVAAMRRGFRPPADRAIATPSPPAGTGDGVPR